MNETAIILASQDDDEQDATANRAIRGVASTPSPQHIIPADIVGSKLRAIIDAIGLECHPVGEDVIVRGAAIAA